MLLLPQSWSLPFLKDVLAYFLQRGKHCDGGLRAGGEASGLCGWTANCLNLSKWIRINLELLLGEKVNRNFNETFDFDKIGSQWL